MALRHRYTLTHAHTHVHGDPHTSTHSQLNEHIHAGGLEEELSLKFGIECQLVKEKGKRGRRRQRRRLSERASERARHAEIYIHDCHKKSASKLSNP